MKIGSAKLGGLLKKKRIEAGLSQVSVSAIFGVNQSEISAWELRKKLPRPKRVKRIKTFLEANPKALRLLAGKGINDHSARKVWRKEEKEG